MSLSLYYKFAKNELYQICRSITGPGIRKSLNLIKKKIPQLRIKSIKSGTNVFDWKIPKEWIIKKAYVIDEDNNILINFNDNNLHLVGYSVPVNQVVSLKSLLKKIHTLKEKPNAIPYITSYYKNYWGFCVTQNFKNQLLKRYKPNSKFKVIIDSKFKHSGRLNYGEIYIRGKSKKEILISTYLCHPSMANNELSGPVAAMVLAKKYLNKKNSKSIRILFIPETIGSIAYLAKNIKNLRKNFIGGYNLTCIGDERSHSCIFSKYKNSLSDKYLRASYKNFKINFIEYSFLERGSDERQYNSPGIDLPVATICRSKFGKYPEYHTSLDNFDIVTPKGLSDGIKIAEYSINKFLKNIIPTSKIYCEPNLGKRGLYPTLSTLKNNRPNKKLLDFLQYSDGTNDLDDISKFIKLDKKNTFKIFKFLYNKSLITI
jgi:aminopeptidase-like protein